MGAAAEAFRAHCETWNGRDEAGWLALFDDDVVFEDPVGGLPKRGRDALSTTWAASQRDDRRWRLEPRRIVECGDEVAIDLVNRGTLPTGEVVVESIEIWKVDADGKVVHVRAFFETDAEVHDPWYLTASD